MQSPRGDPFRDSTVHIESAEQWWLGKAALAAAAKTKPAELYTYRGAPAGRPGILVMSNGTSTIQQVGTVRRQKIAETHPPEGISWQYEQDL